jgi:Uncharacterized alpha/beta hydrolase domain (DUF2235)
MFDQVSFYPAGKTAKCQEDLARSFFSRLARPTCFREGRIFVAGFDGTCNSLTSVPITNVAKLANPITTMIDFDSRMRVHYIPGPGTQCDIVRRALDSMLCYSFEWRVRQMRIAFLAQLERWRFDRDTVSNCHVGSAQESIGFTRGCALAAAFSRMVDVERLSVSQAVGFFDPVCTGVPRLYDRRLPQSVKCGMQITAIDERRDMFVSSSLIDDGLSHDDRYLNVRLNGEHCDIWAAMSWMACRRRV